MNINTDINILGGLPDLELIRFYMQEMYEPVGVQEGSQPYTSIKTVKSVKRFEKAITTTLLKFDKPALEILIREMINGEGITNDTLLLLYWNASVNNDLLKYLNEKIYFTSFFSGRVSIKADEVVACLKDLRERESELKKWADYTLQNTASKYLTLLKKFNLMEGSLNKTIIHPYLSDKMFVLFVYWLTSIESKSNLLESEWLNYAFCERTVFVERIMQKKFSKYFQLLYTGDKLKIETTVPYSTIYDVIR